MATYFIKREGMEQSGGPFTEDQMRAMFTKGEISEDTLVWKERESEDWVALTTCPEVMRKKIGLKRVESMFNSPSQTNSTEDGNFGGSSRQGQRPAVNHSEQLSFWGKVSNAWNLMGDSAQVLLANKSLLVLPLVSSVCALLVFASFAVPTVYYYSTHQELLKEGVQQPPIVFVGLFLWYFVNYTVIIFFNAALIASVSAYLKGQACTVGDGLKAAASRLPAILGWAAIAATIGLLLQIIENACKDRKTRWIAQIIVSLIGAAWTLVTFLVLPVLVIQNVGPITALKSSWQLLKRTWGEQIVGNLSFGFIFGLLSLPGVIALGIGTFSLASDSIVTGLLFLSGGVTYLILIGLVQAAIKVIYQTALYYYVYEGQAPQGFSSASLANSFASHA